MPESAMPQKTLPSNTPNESSAVQLLDARYLKCPHPVLRTHRLLAQMEKGNLLEVWATDGVALKEIPSFCEESGHQLLEMQPAPHGPEGGYHRFLIRCA
jgi:tRNA 2-thiouridine synthesizing protein A